VLCLDRSHGDRRDRRHRSPVAKTHQHVARHGEQECRVDLEQRELEHAEAGDERARYDDTARPEAPLKPAAERRDEQERDVHRQPRDPGLQGGIALHVLEVERDEEQGSGKRRVEKEIVEARDRERSAAEEPEREHRLGMPRLIQQKRCCEHGGGAQKAKREGRGPGVVVGLDESEGQAEQGGCAQSRPDEIESTRVRVARLAHVREGDGETDNADRHVHPEDCRPVEHLDQQAAEHGPETKPEAGDRRPDADRPRPPIRLERIDKDRERKRRQERGADALEGPKRDQHPVARRERAAGREDREQREAGQKNSLAPVPIAERAADEDERRERERVRVDRPDEIAGRDVELVLNRRQRNVHDRDVEQDHELREAGGDERPALSARRHRRRDATAGRG
jgi:hypothetical protein